MACRNLRVLLPLWFLLALGFVNQAWSDNADSAAPLSEPKSESDAPGLLTIGSTAPMLDIEHWVQNGDGRFEPVTSFEEGQVYVVEFWATWCPLASGACRTSANCSSSTRRKG